VVHRNPHLLGVDRNTWTLCTVRSVVNWLAQLSLTSVFNYLRRFALRYKRGRSHVHSPDPLYDQKIQAIERARDLALQAPGDVVFLYVDEHTANLRPRVGRNYRATCEKGQKATGSASRLNRLAGALDVASGQVITRRRARFPVQEMYRFFYYVEQHYPDAKIIYIALDNWPVHFHGYVRDNLARIKSKIRLLPLPTYAPWTNPIEKFWLKLNREFMSQHPYGQDEKAFREALDLWLDKHREESAALLHEVGLLPDCWEALPD
jgi:transposase